MIIGVAALVAALFLWTGRRRAGREAADLSGQLTQTLGGVIVDTGSAWTAGDPPLYASQGYSCLGLLQIGQTELPVVTEDEKRERDLLPVWVSGTPASGLRIEGPDYPEIFGLLSKVQAGDQIYFTDMLGERTCYVVETAGFVRSLDQVQDTGLVLLSRRIGGYRLVSCSRKEAAESGQED